MIKEVRGLHDAALAVDAVVEQLRLRERCAVEQYAVVSRQIRMSAGTYIDALGNERIFVLVISCDDVSLNVVSEYTVIVGAVRAP